MRHMDSAACSTTKPLGVASQMGRVGNRVSLNPPWDPIGSYIERGEIGERLRLEEQGALYVLRAKVAPQDKQTSNINK